MSEDRLDKALEAMKNENVNAGELAGGARSRLGKAGRPRRSAVR